MDLKSYELVQALSVLDGRTTEQFLGRVLPFRLMVYDNVIKFVTICTIGVGLPIFDPTFDSNSNDAPAGQCVSS